VARSSSTDSVTSAVSSASSPISAPGSPRPAPPPSDRKSLDRRSSRRGGVIKFEDEKEIHRKAKKDLIVQEIQASEQLYYKFLDVLIRHFIKPLRKLGFIPSDQLKLIFGNLDTIAPYHKQIAEELEKEDAGEVYAKYADYLKVYTPYIVNYDQACDCLAALKKNKEFQSFLAFKRNEPECGGLDISSFLIMPIQRIPRYPLLLTELKKYTRVTDEEHASLDEALEKVSIIANFVNEAKRQAENRTRIIAIQNQVSGEFENLLQPSRVLIHEAPILLKKKRSTKAHLYLFNDLILWTTPSHHLLGVCNLPTCSISEYTHKKKIGFTISSAALPDGELNFVCRTVPEKKLWMNQLNEALEAIKAPLMHSRNLSLMRKQRSEKAEDAQNHQKVIEDATLERLKKLGVGTVNDSSLQPKAHS